MSDMFNGYDADDSVCVSVCACVSYSRLLGSGSLEISEMTLVLKVAPFVILLCTFPILELPPVIPRITQKVKARHGPRLPLLKRELDQCMAVYDADGSGALSIRLALIHTI